MRDLLEGHCSRSNDLVRSRNHDCVCGCVRPCLLFEGSRSYETALLTRKLVFLTLSDAVNAFGRGVQRLVRLGLLPAAVKGTRSPSPLYPELWTTSPRTIPPPTGPAGPSVPHHHAASGHAAQASSAGHPCARVHRGGVRL